MGDHPIQCRERLGGLLKYYQREHLDYADCMFLLEFFSIPTECQSTFVDTMKEGKKENWCYPMIKEVFKITIRR